MVKNLEQRSRIRRSASKEILDILEPFAKLGKDSRSINTYGVATTLYSLDKASDALKPYLSIIFKEMQKEYCKNHIFSNISKRIFRSLTDLYNYHKEMREK